MKQHLNESPPDRSSRLTSGRFCPHWIHPRSQLDKGVGMLTERFNRLWSRLVRLWFAYQNVPRTQDDVVDLAAARIALDGARPEIAAERRKLPLLPDRAPR
jgi:hypothetical protein